MSAYLEKSQSSHRRNYFPDEYVSGRSRPRPKASPNAFVAQRVAPNKAAAGIPVDTRNRV